MPEHGGKNRSALKMENSFIVVFQELVSSNVRALLISLQQKSSDVTEVRT